MAPYMPPELWLHVASFLPYFTIQNTLRPTCRCFFGLYANKRLHGLTPRLWEQVFSHLYYFKLLDVKETCLDFCDLLRHTKSPNLQRIMFREKLENVLASETRVNFHPILGELIISPNEGVITLLESGVIDWNYVLTPHEILKESVLSETITSPPVQTMTISIPGCEPVTIAERRSDGLQEVSLPITIGSLLITIYKTINFFPEDAKSSGRIFSDHDIAITGLSAWEGEVTLLQVAKQYSTLDDKRVVIESTMEHLVLLEILHVTPWEAGSSRQPTAADESELLAGMQSLNEGDEDL